MEALDLARKILATNLQLEGEQLSADTEILGNFPQFNSLTIVGIIESIENELGCSVDDEEIKPEVFATVADLASFIETKKS